MPKTIQKCALYESQNSLGHCGTTRLYQFLKKQYYWKGLWESVQKFVRYCPQCQTTNLQTPNYVQLHLEIPQMPMDFISMNLIGPLEATKKGNQCTLTVICMLTNYIICVPIPDKSTHRSKGTFEDYTVDSKEAKKFCQIMEADLKIHYFQKLLLRDKTFLFILIQTSIKWTHRSFTQIS